MANMRVLLSEDNLGLRTRISGQGVDQEATGVMDSEALAMAYAYPELLPEQSWVRANFISTLDGAAAGDDGRSSSINTGGDRDVFRLLRALCDVILVGAGTARVEGYRRATVRDPWSYLRHARPAHPTMAVVSRSADIPPMLSQARESSGEVLLVTCGRAGAEAVDLARETLGEDQVIVEGEETVDLAAAMGSLVVRGLPRILCEGGPHLMGDLAAAGCLDELCLSIAPLLVGADHPRITAGPALTANLVPRLLIESEGTLIGRWVRQ
jgi:riboflavin biosynthesis pyrimidine reductase